MPRNIMKDLGKPAMIKYHLDLSHIGNMVNRRFYYDIIIYGNNSPINWYSKRHNTFESSIFVSEFLRL